jgi:outer membrane receptor for Fe3+-dicitrate
MTASSQALNEVTVQARRKANTEFAVLDERKKAAVVQDAISAVQIERTASITTTQALQRVPGVTVTDDKYVAIRGLGDRSVVGQLNGVRLASSDPDRSAIPFDLVPASLLDNVTTIKPLPLISLQMRQQVL